MLKKPGRDFSRDGIACCLFSELLWQLVRGHLIVFCKAMLMYRSPYLAIHISREMQFILFYENRKCKIVYMLLFNESAYSWSLTLGGESRTPPLGSLMGNSIRSKWTSLLKNIYPAFTSALRFY